MRRALVLAALLVARPAAAQQASPTTPTAAPTIAPPAPPPARQAAPSPPPADPPETMTPRPFERPPLTLTLPPMPPGAIPTTAPLVVGGPLVDRAAPPQSNDPLTLHEVLTSVEERYPLLLSERQSVLAAEGEEYSAWGSFDPKWKTKGQGFPVGYYQYGIVDSYLEQPLYWQGMSVFGGYRLGQGKFPIYYDGYRTNSYGEARVGATISLLRGGSIDEERAKLWKAEAGVDAAREGFVATKLDFQRTATQKYWEWVTAAKKLDIAKTLLQRAVDRNVAVTQRVTKGDIPAVERTDNLRLIAQREQQVVAAERYLTSARLALSLYLRDTNGNPVIPSPERVPKAIPEPDRLGAAQVETDVVRALERRPEMKIYAARRRQYEVERKLAENDALPSLDLLVAGGKQFGDGYPEKQPATLEIGVMLEIPLRTRKADGRAAAAEARFTSYHLQLRYTKDKITNEVRDAAAGTDAAASRLALARRELELARALEQAEKLRFDMGDSTILFVNIREQTTFDAATKELDTILEQYKALAQYRAVIGGA